MDAFTAGRLSRSIDPLHSISYFAPETAERFGAIGMEGRMPYFAARSAPMGALDAAMVAATFYNFSPALVAKCIPAAWRLASPQTVTTIRYEIVDQAVPRVLGELARSKELSRVAAILRRAAEGIPHADGRPLFAAHSTLEWPESAHGQLWHAVTLLREYRGDGHVVALVANELSGLEALVTHTASGIGFSVEFARRLRGWTEEEWTAGADRLRRRGLLDDRGALTAAGAELRSRVEDLTDALAYEPWRSLSDEDVAVAAAVATSIREAVRSAELFPGGAFGPRYGEHR
jgi:Helix-turn-helix family